jgi:5' nucleotidase, deoxy (Pyrimidine), cytosolic type C protein (NT5C)
MAEHPLKGTILDVDLDGVCADFYGKMREIASEWFERPVDELPLEVSYGLHEWGIMTPDQYASLHRFAVTQRGLFEDSPMIPGGTKVSSEAFGRRRPHSNHYTSPLHPLFPVGSCSTDDCVARPPWYSILGPVFHARERTGWRGHLH